MRLKCFKKFFDVQHACAGGPSSDVEAHQIRNAFDPEIFDVKIDGERGERFGDGFDSFARAKGIRGIEADADVFVTGDCVRGLTVRKVES